MKPLTKDETLRALLRAIARKTPQPSVRLWTARKEVQVEVIAYGRTPAEAGTAARKEFDLNRDRYALEAFMDHETYDAAVQDGTPFD